MTQPSPAQPREPMSKERRRAIDSLIESVTQVDGPAHAAWIVSVLDLRNEVDRLKGEAVEQRRIAVETIMAEVAKAVPKIEQLAAERDAALAELRQLRERFALAVRCLETIVEHEPGEGVVEGCLQCQENQHLARGFLDGVKELEPKP